MTVLDYRSGLEEYDPARGRPGTWFSWGCYLGVSWTWCIGMYLPVILVRDYGILAWFIFAIPNVVGAAAMGWVLKDHTSQSIVVAHGLAMKIFSVVTATFQIFFALWMFEEFGAPGAAAAAIVFAFVVLRASQRNSDVQGLAGVVFMASLVTIFFQLIQGALHTPLPVPLKPHVIVDLVALAPVCCLGFGLCPYLDATFHRARQQLPEHHARAAFSVGFGFFFFVMILYSLFYARILEMGSAPARRAGVIAHWIFQLGFTVGVHWFGLPREGHRDRWSAIWARVGISVAVAIAAWFLTVLGPSALSGEILYRCFMGFYGLLFPAYVWLCMLPGRGRRKPTDRQWMVCGITILVALPLYWLGFVEKHMFWLLPGVAVVLLARFLIKPLPSGETFDEIADNLEYERNEG
jgi:hypothetical protein